MTIQDFELHLITDNPWQTRPLDEAHAAELAADIAERWLLQAAVGRIHPERPYYVQLATGHHRLAAYRSLATAWQDTPANWTLTTPNPWLKFPIDVRELTDLQMAQTAIAENKARKDLTAMEKAQTLQRLIGEFHLSQAEAGKPFGLGQAAVSHLLRLLKLPAPIQAHVQSGALPEAYARQLVSIAKVFPQEAQKIADAVAKAEPDQRQAEFDEAESEFERKKGVQFYGIDWKPTWPAAPIKLDGHKSLTEIPSCIGCEFYRKTQYGAGTCLRPECFEAKTAEWNLTKVPAAAKKVGLPAGVRGQTYAYLVTEQADEKYIEAVLKSKHASLVIVPSPSDRNWRVKQTQRELLGSELVTLATSQLQALWLAVPKPKEKAAPKAKPAYDYKLDAAEREAKEKEIDRLFETAAPLLARHIPFGDLVTQLLWDTVEEVWGDQGAWKKSRTPAERAALFVRALMAHRL